MASDPHGPDRGPSISKRWIDAIDERTGLRDLGRAFSGRQIHGAPSWGRSLGAASLALFILAAATGLALAFVYSPSVGAAWASVAHLETAVPLGSFVRAVHYHTASALFVVALLHLTHIVANQAYRRPREAGWVIGLGLFLLVPLFAMTGNLLPMDEDGYWGARVELEVVASAPAGALVERLLLGGAAIGNATLTRFFALHALVLPAIFGALAALHVVFSRRRKAADDQPMMPFIPRAAARDATVAALAIVATLLVALALGPARLDAPADPAADFRPRPEWYFMALNQLSTLGGTSLAIGAPLFAIGCLFALPFVDRRRVGRASVFVLAPLVLTGIGFAALTARGLLQGDDDAIIAKAEGETRARAAAAMAAFMRDGVDASGRVTQLAGYRLYVEAGCAACHDDPEVAAPRLAAWGSVERTAAFLAAPDDARYFAGTPLEGLMEPFKGDAAARDTLSRWLLADSGLIEPPSAATLTAGRRAFDDAGCADCHNDPAMPQRAKAYDFKAAGPDLVGYAGREWTRALIRDANHPTYFGGVVSEGDLPDLMPAFPDLSDDELSLLVRWLVAGAPGAR